MFEIYKFIRDSLDMFKALFFHSCALIIIPHKTILWHAHISHNATQSTHVCFRAMNQASDNFRAQISVALIRWQFHEQLTDFFVCVRLFFLSGGLNLMHCFKSEWHSNGFQTNHKMLPDLWHCHFVIAVDVLTIQCYERELETFRIVCGNCDFVLL